MAELVTDAASGLQKLLLTHPEGSTAEVFLYGGQACSFKVDGREILFVTEKVVYKAPKPIRGGVPICWPQLSDFGPLQAHGFARNCAWALESRPSPTTATLVLTPGMVDAAQSALFPHDWALRVTHTLAGRSLSTELEVRNCGTAAMPFTAALHTYFRVADAGRAGVGGLGGVDFMDSTQGRKRCTEPPGDVRFAGETDRFYLNPPGDLVLRSGGDWPEVIVERRGFPDAIVWNPGPVRSLAFSDLGPEEYRGFACVEAAIIATPAVVAPGGASRHGQTITVAGAR